MNTCHPQLNGAASSSARARRIGCIIAAAAAVHLAGAPAHAATYGFSLLAGGASALDHTDGSGTNARFLNPTAVAVDGAGNIYVADGGDHTVRRVSPGGVVTTYAGTSGRAGSSDGAATSGALFLYPYAVAVDGSNNVFVADSGNHNIRMISAGGSVSTLAGTAGVAGSADGTGAAARFNGPQGIAIDGTGVVYVSDTNNSTIRRITPAGVVTTLAGAAGQTGGADGGGASARFFFPAGIAVDAGGNVYVADLDNSAIRKVTPGGSVSTLAGSAGSSGSLDGQGGAARFNHPSAVAVDGAGFVYVIDTSNQTVREVSPGGSVSTLAGSPGIGGSADGTGAAASFFYPGGIASTPSGVLYVADTGNHTIRAMNSPGSVTTLAGSAGRKGDADGTGGQALFAYPYGVAIDGSGHLYVSDSGNNTIRAVTPAGVVTTLAGSGGFPAGSADGAGGAARFNSPAGVAVDGAGNVYVADSGNSTIRKIAPGGAVTTLAGAADTAGSSDGLGAAARFNTPEGVAVDAAGNVYVADTRNDTVRKITPGGQVTTLAGAAGQTGSGDGAGGSARFNGPYAVAVDGSGNVFVSDFFNATIRKIDASGTVSTVAGSAGALGFADGAGAAARFNQPYALALDGSGDVFVADTYNRAVREITPGGLVATLNGAWCRFYYPQGIAVGASGTLYVADGDNQAVMAGAAVSAPPGGTTVQSQSVTSGQNASFSVTVPGSPVTYQWQTSVDAGATWSSLGDNSTFSGSTAATLTLTSPALSMSGDLFRVQLANAAGANVSGSATLTVSAGTTGGGPPTGGARLINLSIRSFVGSGTNTVIVGFYISGSGSKELLIRADGPTLASFGVTGVLANPQLTLFNASSVAIGSDTAWGGSAALAGVFASVGAFALPAASADSALFTSLPAGANTVLVGGVNGESGIALAELYDADGGNPPTQLTNVSARAYSGTGSAILTAGFVIGGSGTETLLIRGIGPGLTPFGVGGVLSSPQVLLFDSTGTQIASNAGWGGTPALVAAFAKVGAFALPPASADSAMIVTLPSGLYTVEVAGTNGSTGVALIEVYEIP